MKNWEVARTVQNGGDMSFSQAASAWKTRPANHEYRLSSDKTDDWQKGTFLDTMKSRSGRVVREGHEVFV